MRKGREGQIFVLSIFSSTPDITVRAPNITVRKNNFAAYISYFPVSTIKTIGLIMETKLRNNFKCREMKRDFAGHTERWVGE